MPAFSTVTLGVANLDQALELWTQALGFEVIDSKEGADTELARLWDILPDDIARQALVTAPGKSCGRVHLVEFNNPEPAIRENAQPFDCCAKNLDFFVDDMAAQIERIRALGYQFSKENYSEIVTSDGTKVYEIHLPVDNDFNVVFLQTFDNAVDFSGSSIVGVGPLVTVVPDSDKEKAFYSSALNLELIEEHQLSGKTIETMIGLPPGSSLELSIMGQPDSKLGRVEILSYEGVKGNNLYPRTKPKGLGILHITYQFPELASLKSHLENLQIPYANYGRVETLAFTGEVLSFQSPAGFRIEAVCNS